MKKQSFLMLILAAAVAGILAGSCKEEKPGVDPDDIENQVAPYVQVINSFAFTGVEELEGEEELKSGETSSCLVITVDDNGTNTFWPRSWTLDFGTQNCEIFPGIKQRGKIHVSLSDWWRNEGSSREIVLEDYYYNETRMDGVKTIVNKGLNGNNNLTFEKSVTGGKLTFTQGSVLTWECLKTSELTEGGDTFRFADDVWSVTGTGSGITPAGKNYVIEIIEPLIYRHGCFYPVSGLLEITVAGELLKTINYGDGECDRLAEVTVGSNSTVIEM